MSRWIGRSVVGIGLVHTAFGFVVGGGLVAEIVDAGFFGTVNGQPHREAIFWFIFFGLLLLAFGFLLDWIESKGVSMPKSIGFGLLAMTVLAVMLMPASGWWLLLAPALGIAMKGGGDEFA